jgi:speckle-type POZ protein
MSTYVRFGLNCIMGANKLSMVFLDKTGSPAPSVGTGATTMDVSVRGLMVSYFLEAKRDDIKANCVVDKDNYFELLCSVNIHWSPSPLEEEELIPDLGHDLAIMSEYIDVSFDVAGETFSAHRLVLAARSPVFKAELYGPMAEGKLTSITIQDMEASTFRSMLHYLYHGSLPSAGKMGVCFTTAEYQHLLIAADRYGVERLMKICENKLCAQGITMDNVISMLELAEDHVCPRLKARCLEYLDDADNFKMVALSDEYIHLVQSFPNLFAELRSRIKKAHEKPTIMEPDSHKKTRLC